jgi:hypothetical protein
MIDLGTPYTGLQLKTPIVAPLRGSSAGTFSKFAGSSVPPV